LNWKTLYNFFYCGLQRYSTAPGYYHNFKIFTYNLRKYI